MRQENERSPERRAFLHYIRTGQRVTKSFFTEGPPLELKFNPNHDPVNGRFTSGPGGGRAASRMRPVAAARRLPSGKLSAKYEAKGDPGRVSSGIGDIGGISYGAYQLSSKNGMAAAFICSPEARRYAAEFNQLIPGTEAFSAKWRAVAARDPAGFADAQHAFIARENYTRAVRGVSQATGFAIDEHSDTLREVVWSPRHSMEGLRKLSPKRFVKPT